MNLHALLGERTRDRGPVRVGVIGAGKFASMFLTQALSTETMHVVGVADLSPERARAALQRTGWPTERYAAASFGEALRGGGTHVTDDADALIDAPGVSTSPSKRAPTMRSSASPSTACARMRPGATARSTGHTT